MHEWLDEDEDRKAERHDITRMIEHAAYVRTTWGEEAVQEYVRHLHDDLKKRVEHVQEELAKQMAATLAYLGIKD